MRQHRHAFESGIIGGSARQRENAKLRQSGEFLNSGALDLRVIKIQRLKLRKAFEEMEPGIPSILSRASDSSRSLVIPPRCSSPALVMPVLPSQSILDSRAVADASEPASVRPASSKLSRSTLSWTSDSNPFAAASFTSDPDKLSSRRCGKPLSGVRSTSAR